MTQKNLAVKIVFPLITVGLIIILLIFVFNGKIDYFHNIVILGWVNLIALSRILCVYESLVFWFLCFGYVFIMDLIYLWEFSENGNKYKKIGFRKVKLMKLNQDAKEIEGEVINDGIKYKVVSYDKNFFDDFKNKELTLQKGINFINFHLSNPNKFLKRLTINVMGSPNTPYLLWCFPNLRSLEIESSNRFIVKENDILYSKPRCSICFISKKMKRLFIRESIRSIRSYACHNSPLLTTIYFPVSLTFIGNGSFKNCERLEKVHFPPNLSFLGPSAFSSCRNLKIVSFEKCQKLKTIKKLTFASTGIEKTVLPKCLMNIDMSAFVFCHALKEIGFQ